MKKIAARVLILMMLLIYALPAAVSAADGVSTPLCAPYEKVIAKSGSWYSEQLAMDGGAKLVVDYLGEYESDGSMPVMEFKIKEEIVLRSIYLPFSHAVSGVVTIQLEDSKGNVFKDLPTEKVVREVGKDTSKADSESTEKISYVFTAENDIVLPPEQYNLSVCTADGAVGAFLIKGVLSSANEKYRKELLKWEAENNPENAKAAEAMKILDNEELRIKSLLDYPLESVVNPAVRKPAAFSLDGGYLIDEIILNTYNNGKGALPGTIAISRENGETVLTQQAYGASLGDTPNGIWKIAPNIILPAGNYLIAISDPNALSFDQAGEPLFYVKASVPPEVRYDFTGTYLINLDTFKTSTLMGSVSSQGSSFSLKDFELAILDKDGEIELIGKYEGMPFSQRCEITEETENKIVAKLNFSIDLTGSPYKAKIGANASVILEKLQNGSPKINIQGAATYQRDASASKGADFNTYSIAADGILKQKDLPPFVMTALGNSGSAGNIPGPDNPVQAAVGILFPPLAGVVISTLQELLKSKPAAKAAGSVRDKSWYKSQNPGLSDEQIAMNMLADAMGNTDNPDEGDAISIGDNEKPGGSDYISQAGKEQDMPNVNEPEPESEPKPWSEPEIAPEPEPIPESNKPEPIMEPEPATGIEKSEDKPKSASEPKIIEDNPKTDEGKPVSDIPAEPEDMVLQTSANGATSRYIKDPATGNWVDAETGSTLDYEKYKETAPKQFAEDKKINDAEFEKMSRGEDEHSKILRDEMKKISDNKKWDDYKNSLRNKYGTDNLETIGEIIGRRENLERESFERWQTIGNVNAVGEVGSTVVVAAADTAIDGLSTITPGGAYIKAGYKVTKGIAGTMAEKGVNTGSLFEGAIKGGADAATDLVDKTGLKSNYAKTALKGILNVAGESGGSAAGSALRGGEENWKQSAVEGLIDGTFKTAVGAVTDKLAGEGAELLKPKGPIKVLSTMKNVLVNKPSAVKIGSSLTDEFGIKPFIAKPIKDRINKSF